MDLMAKILFVEDDDNYRLQTGSAIEEAGHKAVLASNGVDGYNLAVTERPDLIVTDRNMPNGDGYEMALRLRENEITSAIRLIGHGDFGKDEVQVLDALRRKGLYTILGILDEFC